MDAATLQPIQSLAARLCSLSDVDAAFVALVARYRKIKTAADELAWICSPGGQADRLAATLDDPDAAAQYVQKIADKFSPFAAILRAVEVTGDDEAWVKRGKGYTKVTTAEAERYEQAEREREARRIRDRERKRAQYVATFAEAAEVLGVKREVVRTYAQKGTLVGVYPDGKRKAVGVTRQSLEAYAEKQKMRKAATLAKAQAKADHKAEKAELGGIYYTESGRKVHGEERVSSAEACEIFSRGRSQIAAWANTGKIERVYIDPNRRHPVGYLRESVERYAAEREIVAAAGGTYYTAAGQIVGAERISRSEAAQLLNFKELSVTAICRRGEIAHVYADAALTIPCGYTRQSVEAYAQAHPRHIPARRAEAIDNFKIQIIPPTPRRHGLRAARLDPDAESARESATPPGAAEPTARHRRERPTIIFRLATWQTSRPPDEPQQEEGQTDMDTPRQESATPQKLEVAKAYTIHDGGVIRAIAVSEADRDEIVAALELYRRAKAEPGEIESALKLLRAARDLLDVPATTTATADEPQAAQADGGAEHLD